MQIDESYHYPPDLLELLVDTIPRLVRGKSAVVLFFRGAGVPDRLLADMDEAVKDDARSVSKFAITRTVLRRLNDGQDAYIRQRREIVRRVAEYEDFSTCWPNEQAAARGYVARVREVVDVKDSFARMRIEHERERASRLSAIRAQEEVQTRRREKLEIVKRDFFALFSESDPHRRGRALEGVVNRHFEASGIAVRESFTLTGPPGVGVVEQIDGVVDIDGEIYLVEMKWWQHRLGNEAVGPHLVRVHSRAEARGIFISGSGYTEAAIEQCRKALRTSVVILCTIPEIVRVLEDEDDLVGFLRQKVRAALIDGEPFHQVGSPVSR